MHVIPNFPKNISKKFIINTRSKLPTYDIGVQNGSFQSKIIKFIQPKNNLINLVPYFD